VTAEIVDDDNVAGLERWHHHLLDIGQEAFAIDRSVDHARSVDAIMAQRGKEGERPPAAMPSSRLVLTDETWAKTNMTRTHGRARRGEPASCSKNGVDRPCSRPEPLRE
jgi:hypothetical protein